MQNSKTFASLLLLTAALGVAQPARAPSYGFTPLGLPAGINSGFAAIADFNGDGYLDIVVGDGQHLVTVVLGNGDGTFGQPIITGVTGGTTSLAATDLNGDGKLDLVVYGFVDSFQSVSILLGKGDGTFSQTARYSVSAYSFFIATPTGFPLAIADFDHDGRQDLAVLNTSQNAVDVMLGNGDGTFRTVSSPNANPSAGFLAAGDFNGDGIPDVVTSVFGGSYQPLTLLIGRGDGTFDTGGIVLPKLPTMPLVNGLATADLNNDGALDIAISTQTGVDVFLGHGDGTFETPVIYPAVFVPAAPFGAGITIADVTADGKPDIIVTYFGDIGGAFEQFPGNGDGTFQTAALYITQVIPASLAVADLNRDGRLDIVIGAQQGSTQALAGVQAPFLRLGVTHMGNFHLAQDDAIFTIQVTNSLAAATTNGGIQVTPYAGAYDDILSMTGPGWLCSINSGCSRNDALVPGAAYPPISMAVRIPVSYPVFPTPIPLAQRVALSGGGSAPTETTDIASVLPFVGNCLFAVGSPGTVSVGTAGGLFDPQVTISNLACPWQAQSSVPWVTVQTVGGYTNYVVAENRTGSPRTAVLDLTSPTGWSSSITISQLATGCAYQLSASSVVVGASAGSNSMSVLTSPDCAWSAQSHVDWITVDPMGRYYSVMQNPGPNIRIGSLTIAGQNLVVYQESPTSPSQIGSIAQLAVGDGWETSLQLVNPTNAPVRSSASFWSNDGSPLPLSVLPSLPNPGTITSSMDLVMPSHATFAFSSLGAGSLDVQTGAARLMSDIGVTGFVRFRYAPRDQEAIVPLELRKAESYVLSFDNMNGIATGVAIANLASSAASIPVVIRDDSGAQIGTGSVALAANGHSAFVLSDQFASTDGGSGTIEFDTPASGPISVLGLRFPPGGRFTTIPVIASTDAAGGSMAHLAVGDGWTSTLELVNFGASSAQAHVQFFSDDGTPLRLPLAFAATSVTTAAVDQTLAPHARLVIQSNATDGAPLQTGSAQLTSNGSVSGFIRFRYGPRDQEAIVPIESSNAATYGLAYDNTNGLATGVAVANVSNAAATIPVIIRDSAGTQTESDSFVLSANGHTSFVLSNRFAATANQTGTIEFDTPAGGSISVLGIRFPASGAFSTIPVVTQ